MMDVYKEVSELRPGSFLKEDLYANTRNPIMVERHQVNARAF